MPTHLDEVDEGAEEPFAGLVVSSGREGAGVISPGLLYLSLYLGHHILQ